MVRLKREVAIIVLKCAIIGFGASEQQAAFGTGMIVFSKTVDGVINTPDRGNLKSWSLDTRLLENDRNQLLPQILMRPDSVASAQQATGDYILLAQETNSASAPAEQQEAVQETKSANTPTEPQAMMQEVKSAARLSSSKQRRRKPKMASVPAGSPALAQGAGEPEPQAVAQEAKSSEPKVGMKEVMEPESRVVAQEEEETDTAATPKVEVKPLKVQVAETGKKKYAMAPIKWKVHLTESLLWQRLLQQTHPEIGQGVTSRFGQLAHTQTAEVGMQTYVMQPYIAQIDGKAGVGTTRNTSPYSSTVGRNNQLYGGGVLQMFAKSRFPFAISYSVKNDATRLSGELTPKEIAEMGVVSKSLNLKQRYRPLGSVSGYVLGYSSDTQHSSVNDALRSRTVWDGDYITNSTEHRTRATVKFNEKVTDSLTNSTKHTDNLVVRDTYLPENSMLALQSFANINRFTDTGSNLSTRYLLANSNATWQPEEESIPLFVDGSAHLFDEMTTRNGGTSKSQSLGVGANATYLFSTRSRGAVGASVASNNSNGDRALSTEQHGNVSYVSESVRLMEKYTYSWSANGGASNLTGKISDSSVFGGVGHLLANNYPFNMLDKKWNLSSSFRQGLGSSISRSNGPSSTITNIGILGLQKANLLSAQQIGGVAGGKSVASESMDTAATLMVSDTRVVGKYPSHTQTTTLNFSLQGLTRGKYSYAGEGLTVNFGLGATYGTEGKGVSLVNTGGIGYSYTNHRLFNVRGLRYVAKLTMWEASGYGAGDIQKLETSHATNNPKYPWALNQHIAYRVGQNEVSLTGKVGDQNGARFASLWLLFRAWRTIAN